MQVRFRHITVLMLVLCAAAGLSAQSFSDRQEIAIFRLSYYGQPVVDPPPEARIEIRGRRGSLTVELRGTGDPRYDELFSRAIGAVDEQIRSAFINLGRFNVIGFEQRLTAASVDDFIDVLSDYQLGRAEIPDAVLLGRQAFTEAEFRELAGGFVVVVPSVSWYDLRRDGDGFRAEMQTSFTFIDIEDLRTFDQFFVETSGYADDPAAAVRLAVDAVPTELTFRIRSMPEFQLRTGILEVDGRDVILEFGRNMGLEPGDEYAIVAERVLRTGHIAASETGLILIREVQQEFSYGTVLYASPRPYPGDQLREVPRRGIETGLYYNVLTNGLDITGLIGLRAVASRGFYDWRPLATLEVPFRGLVAFAFLPVNLSVGTEWNAYLGRMRITPSATVGVGGAVPLAEETDDSFYLSHIGATLRLAGSLLVSRDVLVSVETGLGYWVGLTGLTIPALSSYGGLIVGGSVTLK